MRTNQARLTPTYEAATQPLHAPLVQFFAPETVEDIGTNFAAVPKVLVGGLLVSQMNRSETAEFMVRVALRRPRTAAPPLFTSANGEILSRCALSGRLASIFQNADFVSADGQPMVAATRLLSRNPLPERVATTDLFHDIAHIANARDLSFAIYGASEEENRLAVANVRRKYPKIRIVAHAHGYLDAGEQRRFVRKVSKARADILWVCVGVPREQEFYIKWKHELSGVGLVKTGGGLLNFLSGSRSRAPKIMQNAGLEWLYRILLEPRRLLWRYCTTNPHALFLLLTRTR
jgi:N-acetylglucosaminyldiphosphoundecaprenol N-acetyl-beta-D-mannosaminyltransferase